MVDVGQKIPAGMKSHRVYATLVETEGGPGSGPQPGSGGAKKKFPRYEDAHKILSQKGYKPTSQPRGDGRSWSEFDYEHADGSKVTLRYEGRPGAMSGRLIRHGAPQSEDEVTPPGYERVVRGLKKKYDPKTGIPWAIAWSMKNRGIKPQKVKTVELELEGGPGSGRKSGGKSKFAPDEHEPAERVRVETPKQRATRIAQKKVSPERAAVIKKALGSEAASVTSQAPLLRVRAALVKDHTDQVPDKSFADDLKRKLALRKVMQPDRDKKNEQDTPPEGLKFLKEDVNYRYAANPTQSCAECKHFLGGSCEIVSGLIRAVDTCDKFESQRETGMVRAVFVTTNESEGGPGSGPRKGGGGKSKFVPASKRDIAQQRAQNRADDQRFARQQAPGKARGTKKPFVPTSRLTSEHEGGDYVRAELVTAY